jgi:hypothetical protein
VDEVAVAVAVAVDVDVDVAVGVGVAVGCRQSEIGGDIDRDGDRNIDDDRDIDIDGSMPSLFFIETSMFAQFWTRKPKRRASVGIAKSVEMLLAKR